MKQSVKIISGRYFAGQQHRDSSGDFLSGAIPVDPDQARLYIGV